MFEGMESMLGEEKGISVNKTHIAPIIKRELAKDENPRPSASDEKL